MIFDFGWENDLGCVIIEIRYCIFTKEEEAMAQKGFLTIDLHGDNQYQARIKLDHAFRQAGRDIYQIRVIHGYHSGTALRELTHTYQTNPKVKRMIPAAGNTTFILRELQKPQ